MEQGRGELRVAPFRIVGPIYYGAYLSPGECRCAHRAGLYAYIYGTVLKILPAKRLRCSGKRNHLRMGRRVAQTLSHIVPFCDDSALARNDRPDRHFSFLLCCVRLLERLAHHLLVHFHKKTPC